MKIKKILIVPAQKLTYQPVPLLTELKQYLRRKIYKKRLIHDGELHFYADMPKILSKQNVYCFGNLRPLFFKKRIYKYYGYPSAYGTPRPTMINKKELVSVVKEVDALLVSTRGEERGQQSIKLARQFNKPIAMIDFLDHQENYGAEDIRKNLCNNPRIDYKFEPGKDYDIYFKKDLPLGYATDKVIPIAPVPVRPEAYYFKQLKKKYDIFYSGRIVSPLYQSERRETVELVQNNFKNVKILDHESQKTFLTLKEFWNFVSESHLLLSPGGIVWDSYRHCEAGLAPATGLIAPRPFVDTVGPQLKDGVNAILYDVELRGKLYHLANKEELVEKIKYYLDNLRKLKQMAQNWQNDVKKGHTIYARSKYILEQMERAFS